MRFLIQLSALALTACNLFQSADTEAPVEAKAPTPPNVLFITLDTTRADHLGLYGYFRDTSPHLDAFSKEAVVFERMIVPMATTLPTHTTMFTGLNPTEHGILANLQHGGSRFVPGQGVTTMAEWLDDKGYNTGAFVSTSVLSSRAGLSSGFDTYGDPPKATRIGGATTSAALDWLGQQSADEPYFMWVHYYDPHNPFTPPKGYKKLFSTDDQLKEFIESRKISAVTTRPTGSKVVALRAHNAYDGEIRYMDDQVQRVLDAASQRDGLDNTIVVIAGDHGEGLNQHGQPAHGLLWHEQLHAPFMIRYPKLLSPARIAKTVSAQDIAPTLVNLLAPEDMSGTYVGQMSGANILDEAYGSRPAFSQTSARQLLFGRPMTYALTTDTEKCVWNEEGHTELWAHSSDPYELTSKVGIENEAVLACTTLIQTDLERQKVRGKELGAGRTTTLDDQELEQLKSLGYLDDDVH